MKIGCSWQSLFITNIWLTFYCLRFGWKGKQEFPSFFFLLELERVGATVIYFRLKSVNGIYEALRFTKLTFFLFPMHIFYLSLHIPLKRVIKFDKMEEFDDVFFKKGLIFLKKSTKYLNKILYFQLIIRPP